MYVVSEDNEDIKTELTRLETDKLDIAEYQAWTYVFGATSTWNDDYAITLPYWPEAYVLWQTFRFQADVTNTWEATLNVNALWAITIKKQHNETLEGWDIEAWQIVTVSFDWTNFQMDSQVATIPTIDIHWQDEKTDWDFEDEFIEYDSITQWNKKIQIWNIPVGKFTHKNLIAGEDIIKWNSLFEEKDIVAWEITKPFFVWDVERDKRLSIRKIWSWIESSKIKMLIVRNWTTTENFNIRIEWDSAWNPSGSLIDNNWVWSVAYNRAGFNVSDAHWYAVATTFSANANAKGFKIQPKKNIVLNTVTKVTAVTATRALLKDNNWTILATATFVWDIATFSTFPILFSWEYYRVELDKAGSSYEQRYTNLASFTPVIWTNFDYVSWSVVGGDNEDPRNLVSITTTAEQEIDLAWAITITKWTPIHIVCYQWIYWSETVDWSNFYALFYAEKNTSTRNSKLRNWSERNVPLKVEVTDDDWQTFSATGSSVTSAKWYRLQANKNIVVSSVTKDSTCTATRAILKNDAWVVLNTSTFSWNVATFANIEDYQFNIDDYFRIELDNNWSAYDERYDATPVAFPIAKTNIDYNTGSIDWTNDSYPRNIDSVWTREILWNNLFWYAISDLFEDEILAKTCAKYAYRLWDIPRIATKNYSVWEIVKFDCFWISNRLTWLTKNTILYLSDTEWALSSVPWTITYMIWNVLDENSVFLWGGIVAWSNILFWPTWNKTTTSTIYYKQWEWKIKYTWMYRVMFTLSIAWGTWYWVIYKNWIVFWTERTITSASALEFSEDLFFEAWDTIDFRVKTTNATYAINIWLVKICGNTQTTQISIV